MASLDALWVFVCKCMQLCGLLLGFIVAQGDAAFLLFKLVVT